MLRLCRPFILSSWHMMPKYALIHSLFHYCALVIIFWVVFELSLVVHYDCFEPLIFGFSMKDILERLSRSQLCLWWTLILSLGFCLIVILVHLGDSCFLLFDSKIKGILDQFINHYFFFNYCIGYFWYLIAYDWHFDFLIS